MSPSRLALDVLFSLKVWPSFVTGQTWKRNWPAWIVLSWTWTLMTHSLNHKCFICTRITVERLVQLRLIWIEKPPSE